LTLRVAILAARDSEAFSAIMMIAALDLPDKIDATGAPFGEQSHWVSQRRDPV
jgi:hypothetical protein